MPQTPISFYHEQCRLHHLAIDPVQLSALTVLENTYHLLVNEEAKRSSPFAIFRKRKLIPGVYLWGSVGIGKTFILDCFYQSLPFTKKRRLHFHAFMQWFHSELTTHQGKVNPVNLIVKALAREVSVLCLDELHVTDITDAMLLRHLFAGLFKEGVCLVTTSNSAPDHLYWRGLQRDQFLPAIDLLKQHTAILHLNTHIDYRIQGSHGEGKNLSDLEKANLTLTHYFLKLAKDQPITTEPFAIDNRFIQVQQRTSNLIWFDFTDLCEKACSQFDYLKIATQYQTIFLSNIPDIEEEARDTITRFIRLIDVFYDKKIRLFFTTTKSIEEIYSCGQFSTTFERTKSRLIEMERETALYIEDQEL